MPETDDWWVKSPDHMIGLEDSLEMPMQAQQGYLTRNEDFFVCNAGPTPLLQRDRWRLSISGEGVARPLTLGYDDLLAMPQKTVSAYLECAGNHRTLFREVLGHDLGGHGDVTKTSWGLGGIGMAEWSGVPLSYLLGVAGIDDDTVHICPKGLDIDNSEQGVEMPLPYEKAMHPDTLVALTMNGQPLPADHGFPARLVVPGWVGTYWVKWLGSLRCETRPVWVMRNTDFYVMQGDDWPTEDYAPALGAPVTRQSLKSSLALSWPARLESGLQTIRGYARSPDAPILSVEWTADAGETWQEADLKGPNEPWGWVEFHFDWDATSGEHVLMTRATDTNGQTQPAHIPFNENSVLFNMVHPHPVIVG